MAVNYVDPTRKRPEMMIRIRCLRPMNGPNRQICNVGTVTEFPESDLRALSPGRYELTDAPLTPPAYWGEGPKRGAR